MTPNDGRAVQDSICASEIWSPDQPSKPSRSLSPKIWRVATYLDQCFAQAITLRQASAIVDLHPDYLSRRFKLEIGVGFHQYVVTLRLRRATTLLVTSTKSVKEISYDVGFQAPEVFSKAFKRCMGCSPTTYRVHHLPFYEPAVEPLAESEVATSSLRTYRDRERSDWFDLISDCWEES